MSPALDISFAAQGTVQQGDIDSPINSPMGKKTRAGKRGAAQPTLLQNTLTKNMATAGRTTRARQVKESAGVARKGTVTFLFSLVYLSITSSPFSPCKEISCVSFVSPYPTQG